MTLDAFMCNIRRNPDKLAHTRPSRWWDMLGDWEEVHTITQNIYSDPGSTIHAHLHCIAGVMWGAHLGYCRDERTLPVISMGEEWLLWVEKNLASA